MSSTIDDNSSARTPNKPRKSWIRLLGVTPKKKMQALKESSNTLISTKITQRRDDEEMKDQIMSADQGTSSPPRTPGSSSNLNSEGQGALGSVLHCNGYDSSPDCFGGGAMKSPGQAIPTPSAKLAIPNENLTTSLIFPHPLLSTRTGGSPMRPIVVDEPEIEGSDVLDEDDEDAFLPDDFNVPTSSPTMFTDKDVQSQIQQALEEQRQELQERHERDLEEALESHLREHGQQWKKDAEGEYARLHELFLKEEERASHLQTKVKESDLEKKSLEEELIEMREKNSRASQSAKRVEELEHKVAGLQNEISTKNKEVESIVLLQSSISSMERKLVEAQTQLDDRTNAADKAAAAHLDELEKAETRALDAEKRLAEMSVLEKRIKDLENACQIADKERSSAIIDRDAAKKETEHVSETLLKEMDSRVKIMAEDHATETSSLTRQIEELQASKAAPDEARQLQLQLDQLRAEYKDKEEKMVTLHAEQVDEFQKKASMKEQEYEQKIDALKAKIKSLEDELKNSIDQQFQEQVALKAESSQWKDKFENILLENNKLEKSRQDLQESMNDICAKHEMALQDATKAAKMESKSLIQDLEIALEKGDSEISKLRAKALEEKDEYLQKIRQVREDHNKEIDDMLKQLDLVEAEHAEKTNSIEELLKQKDVVISALGHELSTAESSLSEVLAENDSFAQRVKLLEEKIKTTNEEMQAKSNEIDQLVEDRKNHAEKEAILREQIRDEAREEMIQRAEVQFGELNSTYKKLKQKFDEASKRIIELEEDISSMNKNNEKIKKEKDIIEADLANQLAEAKAAMSAADLTIARKAKQFRLDLQAAQESKNSVETRLAEALATSNSVQRTLASLVAEKERLLEENKDLKAVSEELLEIVEGQK